MSSCEENNERLHRAIRFAVDHHAGQLRKGTTIPYIVHPLEVMSILMRMNADTDLMIAGVLHDTVEDTDATLEQIAGLFGDDVAALVGHHSEDKSKSWDERKTHAINTLANADLRLKMLVMADKLSNLRSIRDDYIRLGEELWSRFNAPKEKQSWYYSGIQDALWDMQLYDNSSAPYWEMVALYKDVFVSYYLSSLQSGHDEPAHLLQICAHAEAVRLTKGCPSWDSVDYAAIDLSGYKPLSRKQAEQTEDEWNKPFWSRIDEDLSRPRKAVILSGTEPLADATLANGLFTLRGQDIGPQCKKINGRDEYEYAITLDEENTKRLLVQLRIDRGIDLSFGELLSGIFPSRSYSTSFMEYCDSRQISFTFHSY